MSKADDYVPSSEHQPEVSAPHEATSHEPALAILDTGENARPLILISNDDGVTAPGIATLVEAVRALGQVVVVAPDSPQSGMGHAVTVAKPLRLARVHTFGPEVQAWQCSGTPVDCVKLAVETVLGGKRPALLVSGINHGSNASINVLYSGTMSAAVEGAIEGIPSIGFSLDDYSWEADFTLAGQVATTLAAAILKQGHTNGTALNVNIPRIAPAHCKGIRVCSQAPTKYVEQFHEVRDDANAVAYVMHGVLDKTISIEDGSDLHALARNYVSVVPVQFDMTAYKVLKELSHALPREVAPTK